MSAWIKIEMTTPDKPEVVCIASALRMDQDAVLGKLIRIWTWADQNSIAGDDVRVTAAFLDRLTGKKGFAAAMREAGWLAGTDGALMFPGFERHNGDSAKARAETNRRVAAHRARNAATVTNVTKMTLPNALPDKSKIREENAPQTPKPAAAAPVSIIEPITSPMRQTFPPSLAASPEFLACWEQRWLPYISARNPSRLPTIQTLDSHLATCVKLGPATAIAALISAIEKSWAAPDVNVKPVAAVGRPSESEPDDWRAYWRETYPPEEFPDAPRYDEGDWKAVRGDHKREIIAALNKRRRRSA